MIRHSHTLHAGLKQKEFCTEGSRDRYKPRCFAWIRLSRTSPWSQAQGRASLPSVCWLGPGPGSAKMNVKSTPVVDPLPAKRAVEGCSVVSVRSGGLGTWQSDEGARASV